MVNHQVFFSLFLIGSTMVWILYFHAPYSFEQVLFTAWSGPAAAYESRQHLQWWHCKLVVISFSYKQEERGLKVMKFFARCSNPCRWLRSLLCLL
jgi:hypothetical protein